MSNSLSVQTCQIQFHLDSDSDTKQMFVSLYFQDFNHYSWYSPCPQTASLPTVQMLAAQTFMYIHEEKS